jgi:surface protein
MKKNYINSFLFCLGYLMFLFSGCEEVVEPAEKMGEVNFRLRDLNFHSLESPNSRVEAVSSWDHIYPSTADLFITNKFTKEEYTLTYNPNDFSTPYSISLPFGSYTFESNVEGGAFEPYLPFFLEGEFTLNSQRIEIELKANTTYGLITVKNKYVSEASLSASGEENTELYLLEDESYLYMYVRGGLDVKLEITESYQESLIERNLTVSEYKHYNYAFQMAEGSVNLIDLVMGPFGFEEEIIMLGGAIFFEENGTIKCPDAEVGEKGMVDGKVYEAVDRELLIQRRDEGADLTCVCTSLTTDMSLLFSTITFNQPIGNWDVSNVTDMFRMFSLGNTDDDERRPLNNFNQPIGNWDVSKVENMGEMFAWSSFHQPIGDWNVSSVTNMNGMFINNLSFNQPIENWDVSNVKDMGRMFMGLPAHDHADKSNFNQPIGNWDVSNVTNMGGMFSISNFNQPIGNWDVSNVNSLSGMFAYSFFDQPIGAWEVGNVKNFSGMFFDSHFNQPLAEWDVSSAENLGSMFFGSKFDQPIGSWNVGNVEELRNIFGNSEFNQNISSWCVSNFATEPDGFSSGSPLAEENKPVWGTCPV